MQSSQRFLLLLLPLSACAPAAPAPAAAPLDFSAPMIVAEADRLTARELWPGFDPRRIPVAIFDGEQTLLFRHPSPPSGFVPHPALEGVFVHGGRHPSVTSNSSAEIGGVTTATLVPPATPVPLRLRAAVLIHEAFHVHQRANHPRWTANEVELFTYPVDDVELLALRRLESEALRRALVAREPLAVCWAAAALELRTRRYASLLPGAAEYERLSELNEGLAEYIERRASGSEEELLPDTEFAADAVRARLYRTGAALALLLDRFAPRWQHQLVQNDSLTLDALLLGAVGERRSPCGFDVNDHARVRAAAESDIRALNARRAAQRQRILNEPGWRVTIVAPGNPLFPQGFDPLNVSVLGSGEVLHGRFLRLGNAAGTVEILGRAALTEAVGAHPLFNGVRSLTVAGLPAEPRVSTSEGTVRVEADGVRIELRGVVEHGSGSTLVRVADR
jgi:hypothetical protein